MLLNAIWVELAYFQQTQSAGIMLANQMTVAGALAAILIVPVFICIDRGLKFNYHHLVFSSTTFTSLALNRNMECGCYWIRSMC